MLTPWFAHIQTKMWCDTVLNVDLFSQLKLKLSNNGEMKF